MNTSIVDATGAPAVGPATYEPPKGSSPFFGWVDAAGDPSSIRYDDITALLRDSRTGRFVILIRQTQLVPQISDRDAERLMKRMGWTKDE